MDQGKVVQWGTHEELMEEEGGKYRELWDAQAQYYAWKAGKEFLAAVGINSWIRIEWIEFYKYFPATGDKPYSPVRG